MDDIEWDSPLTRLKYVGPYLSQRFITHSLWPPDHPHAQLHPIRTLGELSDFVRTRRGRNAKRNLSEWLRLITENARTGLCVDSTRIPGRAPEQYRIRPQNLFGHTMILNFLREALPAAHHSKIPQRQSHPTTEQYQRPCSHGIRRPALAMPPRNVIWSW